MAWTFVAVTWLTKNGWYGTRGRLAGPLVRIESRRFTASSPTRKAMNALLRGIIGGFCSGGAPRPSGAGSTRQPAGCFSGWGLTALCGGELSGGESGARALNVPPNLRRDGVWDRGDAVLSTS